MRQTERLKHQALTMQAGSIIKICAFEKLGAISLLGKPLMKDVSEESSCTIVCRRHWSQEDREAVSNAKDPGRPYSGKCA